MLIVTFRKTVASAPLDTAGAATTRKESHRVSLSNQAVGDAGHARLYIGAVLSTLVSTVTCQGRLKFDVACGGRHQIHLRPQGHPIFYHQSRAVVRQTQDTYDCVASRYCDASNYLNPYNNVPELDASKTYTTGKEHHAVFRSRCCCQDRRVKQEPKRSIGYAPNNR
jgi:hypothetical protein